jgi:hypothetical protein
MKGIRNTLFAVLFAVLLLSAAALAQSDTHKHEASAASASAAAPPSAAAKSTVPVAEAKKSFTLLKTLAGEWEGPIETDFPGAKEALGKTGGLHVTMRVTSRGNVLVHEFQEIGTLLDPTKYDHPVTMFYLDQEKVNLVHYCDAGNRPKMLGTISPDGKTLEFDFAELSGSDRFGHMHHAKFTFIDENRHIEEWTFMLRGKDGVLKPVQAKFDLKRVDGPMAGAAPSGGR